MGLVVAILIVWGVVLGFQWWRLTHQCYEHVKEQIRAEQQRGHRSIRMQERAALFRQPGPRPGGLYQPSAITPASPFRYVKLLPGVWWPLSPSRRNLRGAVIHWTPLVNYPDSEWLDGLTNCIAHFLGLPAAEVEMTDVSTYRKRAKIVRASS